MADRLRIHRLNGEPSWGDVVLKYESVEPEWATIGWFTVVPNGFDKYLLRDVPNWRWIGNCWRFPAFKATLEVLSAAYEDALVLHDTAVEKVEELLEYDPSEVNGRLLYRGEGEAGAGGAADSRAELIDIRNELDKIQELVRSLPEEEGEGEGEDEGEVEDDDAILQRLLRDAEEEEEEEEDEEDETEEETPTDGRGVDLVAVLLRIHDNLSSIENVLQGLPRIERSVSVLEDRFRALSDTLAQRVADIESRLPVDEDDGREEAAATVPDEATARASLVETIAGFGQLHSMAQDILVDGIGCKRLFETYNFTDWTAIINSCGRALEIESVKRILLPLRVYAKRSTPRPTFVDDRLSYNVFGRYENFLDLRNILRGAKGASSKQMAESDRKTLEKLIHEAFPNDHGRILGDIQEEIEEFWAAYRIPASHNDLLEKRKAQDGWDIVVEGRQGSPGLLAQLVRIGASKDTPQ